MGLFIRGRVRPEAANPLSRVLIRMYRPVIRIVLRHRWPTVIAAAVLLVATAFPWSRIGSEFMPPLHEGAIMDMPSLFPGIGTAQARAVLEQRDAALARIPEVATVLGKIGRAETATDMAPMSMIETIAILKDRREWRPGVTYDSIVSEANAVVRTPGVANMWSMPIKNRLDMLATGIKTPVGVKIFGPSLDTLDRLGQEVERALAAVPGTNTVFAERSLGGRYVDVSVDAGAAARFGLTTGDVQAALATAVGGAAAGQVFEGRERFGVLVRYPRGLRDSPERMANVIVPTSGAHVVTLGQLARIDVVRGPALVKSENATPNNVVYVDVRDRDVGSYVAEARRAVERAVALPTGYRLEWSGQYEALERASERLRWVVPVTLLIIYLLLHANFRSAAESALIMLSLPFALVGGVWYLWLLGYHMSVAVAVGLIALAGVAAETGVVMLLYLDHAFAERVAGGAMRSRTDLDAAVETGAVERLRPKMMTVTAIMAGLIPILWSEGVGADVMKRIAAPMVGGMVTSTLLVLLVLPALYSLWKGRHLPVSRAAFPE
jgi:Cu(I)/Ag(I) efflux system membrane protein CusA/SilA